MASLSDGTAAGTINSSPIIPVTPTPPVTPTGAGTAPAATSTTTPVTPTPVTAPAPTTVPQPAYNATTGLLTDYGKSQGLPEVNAPKTSDSTATTTNPNIPDGMSQADYDAFKKANPDIEPDDIDVTRQQLAQTQADYQTAAANVANTIKGIQNGAIPLNAGEQAQVDGLTQQYSALIQAQQLQNTGAQGLQNIRGYQTGSAEYDPTFQVKTIGSIVTAGLNKVADLQTKEASAVAALTQSLKDGDIAAIKDAWAIQQDATEKRQAALQKTIDDSAAAIKAAQDAQQKVTDGINSVTEELAKNGAPADVIAAATKAGSVAGAIAAGVGYFQDPTSDAGQYQAYVKATLAKGLTPMAAGDFLSNQKSKAAYNSAYSSEAAKLAADNAANPEPATGANKDLSDAFNSAALGLTAQQQKSAEATFKQYLASGDTDGAKEYILRVATQGMPTDQQNQAVGRYQALNSLSDIQTLLDQAKAKGADTGILNGNIQNVSQKLGNAGNPDLAYIGNRIASVLQTYRRSMTGVAFSPAESAQYDAIFPSTTKTGELNTANIDALKDSLDSNNRSALSFYMGDSNYDKLYGSGATATLPSDRIDPKSEVDTFVESNPTQAEDIAKLYEVPGATDEDIFEYLKAQGKIK